MINNLEQIKSLLKFESGDDFYHLQIIKRKKEHPELGSNSYIVKTYYIKSIEHLDKVFPEIVNICNFHNARAGINLNRRSFEKIAFHTLKKVTDCILNKDYKSVRKAYESVCGAYSNDSNKKWIIDLDGEIQNSFDYIYNMNEIIENIEPVGHKTICRIPTKNGSHLVTIPFNIQKFKEHYSEIEVHKNNPTILYIP